MRDMVPIDDVLSMVRKRQSFQIIIYIRSTSIVDQLGE